MDLLPVVFPLALVGAISVALTVWLICFVAGVHKGDRADLSVLPDGPCSRFARRTAGLHVVPSLVLAAEDDEEELQFTN